MLLESTRPEVRLTDGVVAALEVALARRMPERGGALLAVDGLVHLFVEDTAGRYSGASWDISARLSDTVGQIERAHHGILAGTVHSHPASVPDPSSQDSVTMAAALDLNPHLDELVVAVLTEGEPRPFDVAIGPRHRLSLHILRRRVSTMPPELVLAAGRVVTLNSDLAYAGCPLRSASTVEEWRPGAPPPAAEAPLGRVVQLAGRPRLLIEVASRKDGALLVDAAYPLVGPLAVRVSPDTQPAVTALPSPWDPVSPAAAQLRALARAATGRQLDGATARTWPLVGSLASKRVLVAGLGSVGSRIAEDLCRCGVGNFVLVDPDTVEASNLARTVYEAADVGRPKTEALSRRLRAVDPAVTVETHQLTLGGADLRALVTGVDLVVGATDHMGEQAVLAHHAYHGGVPMVACALYKAAAAGEVVLAVPSAATACWFCAVGEASGVSQYRPDRDYGAGGRLAGEVALGPSIHLVANVATITILGLLAGAGTPVWERVEPLLAQRRTLGVISTVAGWEFFAELFAGHAHQHSPQSVWVQVQKNPDCPVCGDARLAPPDPRTGSALADMLKALAGGDSAVYPQPQEPPGDSGTTGLPRIPPADHEAGSVRDGKPEPGNARPGRVRPSPAGSVHPPLPADAGAAPSTQPPKRRNTTRRKVPIMAQKFSKRGVAPQKNRSLSSSNRTGGQNPLKEANRRDAKKQNNNHGTVMKQKGRGMY